MSKKIDERVVEMRFDNKQFESATKETMSTLDKLKQKLQLKDASKGLGDLEKAAKKVDLNPLSKSAEMVTAKFSAMQVAGVTAIANLTNSAVNAGKNITKALTIEPVFTGFQEYETQIGAIQTILANTQKEGTNVERVNAALDELNLYADQTIYNFTEMTRNIGTFTAAGVKLDDSVSAIKGIANLAAVSGSTSLQASTAMYQLSQALAAGKVSLMDWNSVVNAGMGGQVFQDALIRTSENLKTGAKEAIATYGTFRESLTQGAWLTTEVLTETLGQLAGAYSEADLLAKGYSAEQAKEIVKLAETAKGAATDVKTFTQLWDTLKEAVQSGWGQTWRMIVGDFDEAKERMTKLSTLFGNIIEKASNRRNSMLSGALDSNWSKLTSKLSDAGIKTEDFQNRIKELAKTHNVNLDEMIEKEGSFEKALKKAFSSGQLDKSILMDAIKSFTGGIRESAEAAKAAGNQMEKYYEIADKVIRGDFGNGAERVEKLTAAGYEYAAVQNIVNEKLGSSVRHLSALTDEQIQNADSLADLTDEQLASMGYTEDQITALKDLKKEADDAGSSIYKLINGFEKPSGVELAWGSVFNILDSITESCKAVKQAWTEIFHPGMTEDQIIAERSERLYKLLEAINSFTERLKVNEETAQKITRTFKGVFAILDLIRMVVGGALNIAFRVLKEVLSAFDMDVLDLTANISDAIVQFHDLVTEHNLLAKAIKFVVPYIKEAVAAVKDWIKSNETIQNGIKRLRSAFNDTTKGIQDWIDNVKEADNVPKYILQGLVNGIKNGASLAVEAIIELGKSILEGIKGVLGIHSPSTEFFEIGKNMIAGLINGIKEGASSLLSFIGNIGQKCIDVISKIDFSKIFTLAISAGIIYSGKKIYELMDKFAAPFEGLGKMFGGIGKAFNSLSKVFDNFAATLKVKKWEIISKSLLNFAIAIGILAGSIYLLSTVEDSKKLWEAVAVVGALALVMIILAKAMESMSGASASIDKNGVKIAGVKTALISIGIALLLMAATVKMIGSLDPEQAKQGFLGLAGLVASIAVVAIAFGTLVKGKSAQNIDKFGKMLTKLSVALLLMALVIKIIGGLSLTEMAKGALFLAGYLVFISLFAKVANATQKSAKSINALGSMLIKISAAMLLMGIAVKLIGTLTPGEMAKGAAFLLAFVGFIKLLVSVTKIGKEEQIAKVGSLVIAIGAAILIMALACKLIGTLSIGDMVKGAAFLAAFLIFVGVLVQVTKIGKEEQIAKVSATILAMSIAIGILAAVCVLLGLVDIATLAKGVTMITILGVMMTGMLKAAKGAEKAKGAIIAMTVAIGIMAAAVVALSFIPFDRLAPAVAGMSILMVAFGVMAKLTGSAQASIAPLIVMTVAVGLLAGIIYALAQLPIDSVFGSAAALSALLLSMSVSLKILSTINGNIGNAMAGMVSLLALCVPLAAFVGILALMSNVENATQNAVTLGAFTVVMTGVLGALTFMGTFGPAAIIGVGSLLALAVPLVAFVGVLALMQGIQNAEKNAIVLGAFTIVMTGVLAALALIGSFGPAAIIGVGSLVTLVVALTALTIALGALNEKFPQLETFLDSGISLLSRLASGMGQVIGSFVSGLAEGLTSSLPGIADNLSSFMLHLTPFIVGAKMLDESSLANVQTLVSIMGALTKTSILESVASWFGAGGGSLVEFAKQLVPFGMYMMQFSAVVSNINGEAVTAAANAGMMMAEMAKSIPREGGWWSKIAGEKDLASFGTKIMAFGAAIKSFSIFMSDFTINEAAITAAANAGKQMSELANDMPKSGGIWQSIAGEQDLASFGSKMVAYAESIKTFATSIDGLKIDEGAMKSSINAATKMNEMADVLPKSGGIWSKIAGEKDIADFGKKIATFGESIQKFASSISGQTSGVDSAVSSVNKLLSMLKNVSGVSSDAIASFKISLSNLGKTSVDGFINSFNGADTRAKAVVSKFLSAISNAVKDKKESLNTMFNGAGKYLVDGFAKGITENTFKAEARARVMALKALEAAKKALDERSPSKKFMKVGAFVVAGFAKGITKNIGDAEKAARGMSNGVLEATQNELGIHSPSVVFDKKVGRYIVQGIAEGIKGDMSAEEAAEKKAQNIVSAFQDALDRIDLGISNRSKDFDLWQLNDGETASDIATAEKQRKKLNDDLWDYNQQVKLTTDKYLTLKETFGENYKATQEAYGAMRDAQITAAQTASSLISIDKSIIASQEEHLDNWKTINENGLEILELESSNGYLVSNDYKDSRYLDTYRDNIRIARTKRENAKKAYDEALAKYGDMNHSVVQEAKIAYQEAYKEWLNAQKTYTDYEDSIVDRELQNIEDSRSHREDIIARWEAENGDDASDRQRYLFYKNMYDTDSIEAWKEYRVYLKSYEDFVADLAENNNLSIEEAKKLKEAVDRYNNEVYPAQTKAIEADKKVSDHRKEYLEQQKEDLKDQYETASDIADLKYQIWEKTSGRDATDAEKDTMKLAMLTEQLGQQAKLVEMARKAWKNAKSDEKQKYEKEYLNAQLELANLQSEVLDIQEENIKRQERALDRQRSAQDEYNDYIKKYEKYYLEHGMTREELEKDAKLVSGYDPNKAINTAVSKTNTAIDTIKTNMSKITEAVGEGIQNGISTVTDSTTMMLKSCEDVLSKSTESWSKAGIVLVVSFISGIQSKLENAVQAGFELASKTLEAMLSVIDSDMEYSPKITPVLDMSKVSAGASKLNSMLTGNTSLNLAKSVSSTTKARDSAYAAKLAEGNGPRNVYEFTQNNYSPKSLSSSEIFRQTRSMFSSIKNKGMTQ